VIKSDFNFLEFRACTSILYRTVIAELLYPFAFHSLLQEWQRGIGVLAASGSALTVSAVLLSLPVITGMLTH